MDVARLQVAFEATGVAGVVGATKQVDQSLGRIGGTASRVGGLIKAAFAAVAIGAAASVAKSFVMAASNWDESLSKSTVIFGEHAAAMESWAKTGAAAFGLNQQVALETASTFGNLFEGMGVGQKAAAGMSQDMVQLAADLASFNNVPIAQALEDIRSGLVGEAEPMRKYGVLLDETTVAQKAMAMTGKTNAKMLTQQDKLLARQALLFEQTTSAQGDFSRTSGGLANQLRILSAMFGNIKITLGSFLLPVVLDAVMFFNQFLSRIQRLMDKGINPLDALMRALHTSINNIFGRTAGNAIYQTLNMLTDAFELFWAVISGGDVGAVFDEISFDAGKLIDAFATAGGAAWDALVGAVQALAANAIPLGTVLVSATLKLVDTILDGAANLWEWFKGKLGVGTTAASVLPAEGFASFTEGSEPLSLGDVFLDAALGLAETLTDAMLAVPGLITTGVKTAVGGAVDLGAILLDALVGFAVGDLWDITQDFGAWLKPKIKTAAGGAVDLGAVLLDALVGFAVGDLWDITEDFGAWLKPKVKLAAGGAVDLGGILVTAIVALDATTDYSGIAADISAGIGAAITAVTDFIQPAVDAIKTAISTFTGWITSTDMATFGTEAGGAIHDALVGIDWATVWSAIKDAVTGIDWSTVITAIGDGIVAAFQVSLAGPAIGAAIVEFIAGATLGLVFGQEKAQSIVDAVAAGIATAFSLDPATDLGVSIYTWVVTAITGIPDLGGSLYYIGVNLMTGLKNGFTDTLDLVFGPVLTALGTTVFNTIPDLGMALYVHGVHLFNGIKNGFSDNLTIVWAPTTLATLGTTVFNYIPDLAAALIDKGIQLVQGIMTGWTQKSNELAVWAANFGGWLSGQFSYDVLVGALSWVGTALVQGIANGITAGAGLVTSAVEYLISLIPGPIQKILGIGSPSKVMMELFRHVPEGAAIGIRQGTREVRQAAAAMAWAAVPGTGPSVAAGTIRARTPWRSGAGGGPSVTIINRGTFQGRGAYREMSQLVAHGAARVLDDRHLAWQVGEARR